MSDISTQYPTLDYLFGCYMHEDWHDDYADEWAAVDAFIAESPPEASGLFVPRLRYCWLRIRPKERFVIFS